MHDVRGQKKDQRFGRWLRVRGRREFQRVFKRRRVASDGLLAVYACENSLPYTRLGVSAPRRIGSAVRRNRWKRIIREAFRQNRDRLPVGLDIVVVPRSAKKPTLAEVETSLVRLASRVARRMNSEHVNSEHGK